MSDLLSWLRSTIEADKAAAIAADKASPGPWVNTGQFGQGSDEDAWQIHGAPTAESGETWSDELQDLVPAPSQVATAEHADGGGVWKREAADHIVLHQPRDTIARCEAELALIDLHKPNPYGDRASGCVGSGGFPCATLTALLSGYRHRPGFNPAWLDS